MGKAACSWLDPATALLIDIAPGLHHHDGNPGGGGTMPVGWGDGSAGVFDASRLDASRYVPTPPLSATGLPVWATRLGFAGRDRD